MFVTMLIVVLFIPILISILGFYFKKRSPKEINCVFGYRTSRSMKNQQTWNFAHKTLGKIWSVGGIIVGVISFIAMLFAVNQTKDFIGNFGSAIALIQTGLLVLSIFPVEHSLKKRFDKDGNPIYIKDETCNK